MPAKGQTGRKHSPEEIQKMRDAVRAAYARGCIPWNKGLKNDPRCKGFTQHHSQETKDIISEHRRGKGIGNTNGFTPGHIPHNKGKSHPVHNEEWKEKVSKANSGPNHWNWKGGIDSSNRLMRSSSLHKEWSKNVFQKDGWTCQLCGRRGQKGEIIAHHIIPWAKNISLRFDVSNGTTLCRACHCHFHKPRTGTGKPPKRQSV